MKVTEHIKSIADNILNDIFEIIIRNLIQSNALKISKFGKYNYSNYSEENHEQASYIWSY